MPQESYFIQLHARQKVGLFRQHKSLSVLSFNQEGAISQNGLLYFPLSHIEIACSHWQSPAARDWATGTESKAFIVSIAGGKQGE